MNVSSLWEQAGTLANSVHLSLTAARNGGLHELAAESSPVPPDTIPGQSVLCLWPFKTSSRELSRVPWASNLLDK